MPRKPNKPSPDLRYPAEDEKKFTHFANERRIAGACIAVLGQDPGYTWPSTSKSSAEYIAHLAGGVVEQATTSPQVTDHE